MPQQQKNGRVRGRSFRSEGWRQKPLVATFEPVEGLRDEEVVVEFPADIGINEWLEFIELRDTGQLDAWSLYRILLGSKLAELRELPISGQEMDDCAWWLVQEYGNPGSTLEKDEDDDEGEAGGKPAAEPASAGAT